jgi:hypothetical protein
MLLIVASGAVTFTWFSFAVWLTPWYQVPWL